MAVNRLKRGVFGFWTLNLLGWLTYSSLALILFYEDRLPDLNFVLRLFLDYFLGFLTTVALYFILKKIRYLESSVLILFGTILTVSMLGSNIWLGASILTGFIFGSDLLTFTAFLKQYITIVLDRSMPLMGWCALYMGANIWMAWKEQKKKTENAVALAQGAQLQMLRYQLNPHFLFNALNSIRALIDEEESKARVMITELSEFLRYSLESTSYADVPLKNELEAVYHYFSILKKRYEEKLDVEYEIDPEAERFPVLSFLLQPLVENAVKYGMQTSPMPLKIYLGAKVVDGDLKIAISNSGKWIAPIREKAPVSSGTGTGLDNVKQRLESAFPFHHKFRISEEEGRVRIDLQIFGRVRKNVEKEVECPGYR